MKYLIVALFLSACGVEIPPGAIVVNPPAEKAASAPSAATEKKPTVYTECIGSEWGHSFAYTEKVKSNGQVQVGCRVGTLWHYGDLDPGTVQLDELQCAVDFDMDTQTGGRWVFKTDRNGVKTAKYSDSGSSWQNFTLTFEYCEVREEF